MYKLFKKKTIYSNNHKSTVQQYYSIKQKLELPFKLKIFFEMLQNHSEQLTQKHKITKQISEIFKSFCKSFIRLQLQQKYYFMLALIKISKKLMEIDNKICSQRLQYECQIQNIETYCKIKDFFMGLSKWQDKIFKFINYQKIVKIQSPTDHKQIIIQLNNYHLRKSTNQKNTLVLEAIFDQWQIPQKNYKFVIYFKQKDLFNEIYLNLKNSIVMTWKKRLYGMLNTSSQTNPITKITTQSIISGPKILIAKTMNEYFKTKEKIQKKISSKQLKFKVFSQIRKIKIYRSSAYSNLYKTQNTIQYPFEQIITNIELISRIPNKKLIHYEKMQNFSTTISAVYYKYVVKGCTHQLMSIVEENKAQNKCKIVFKAIQSSIVQKNVDFLQINVHKQSVKKTKITVFGFINFDENKKLNPISVIDFLLSIVEYQSITSIKSINNKAPIKQSVTLDYPSSKIIMSSRIIDEVNIEQDEDDFHTVVGDDFSDDEDREFQMCNTFPSPHKQKQKKQNSQDDEQTEEERDVMIEFRNQKNLQINKNLQKSQSKKEVGQIIKQNIKTNYLKKKSILSPGDSTQPKDLLKIHYFEGQWSKYEKGGVFCMNTLRIDKQKQIFKSIIARMGNSLMKKNFSNLSLPVILFKPESQLQSIARNLSFAPLLLQRLEDKDSIQRMKSAIILMLSMGTIGLSLQKPFNPIIGQTYQGFIDNCPVYMQQIQHHPAITTMYFMGRGYTISGSVNPSISIRLNSVKCYSESTIKITFQNLDVIEFTPGKMLIGGLLVGDRTFDFIDTIYLNDRKNKVVAEVNFGSKKKFTKNMKGDKNDFISGYIYRVSESFMQEFLKSDKKISPQNDKNSIVISQVYGCWHQKIFIDEKQFFDFQTDLPFRLVREEAPLKSDSSNRMDIQFLEKDNLEKAQDQKDKLQNQQRNDTKLRKINKIDSK